MPALCHLSKAYWPSLPKFSQTSTSSTCKHRSRSRGTYSSASKWCNEWQLLSTASCSKPKSMIYLLTSILRELRKNLHAMQLVSKIAKHSIHCLKTSSNALPCVIVSWFLKNKKPREFKRWNQECRFWSCQQQQRYHQVTPLPISLSVLHWFCLSPQR